MKILLIILRTVVAFFICLLLTNAVIYYMLPKMGYALVSTDAEGNIPVINALALDGNIRDCGIDADRVVVMNPRQVNVYMSFSRQVEEGLILKGYDRSGIEVARARQNVKGQIDEAANVQFIFAPEMSLAQARSFQLTVSTKQNSPINEDVSELVPAEKIETSVTPTAVPAEK